MTVEVYWHYYRELRDLGTSLAEGGCTANALDVVLKLRVRFLGNLFLEHKDAQGAVATAPLQ